MKQHTLSISTRTQPIVALAIDDRQDPTALSPWIVAGVGLLELRIDQYRDKRPDALLAHVRACAALAPCLITIRAAWEGGAWEESEAARQTLYETLIPEAAAVDIELAAKAPVRDAVIAAAHARGIPVILSHHNFETTPSRVALDEKASAAWEAGADYFKVAATCQNLDEVQRLAAFTLDNRDRNIVTIGMGPAGTLSRVFFPALGSKITYTFLGEATAPGQLDCETTLAHMAAFYPDFTR